MRAEGQSSWVIGNNIGTVHAATGPLPHWPALQSSPTDELSTLLVVAALQAAGYRLTVYQIAAPPAPSGSGSQAQCTYDTFDLLSLRLSPRHVLQSC